MEEELANMPSCQTGYSILMPASIYAAGESVSWMQSLIKAAVTGTHLRQRQRSGLLHPAAAQ